jgi:ribosomal-protein-alanine N-acetyltransferase
MNNCLNIRLRPVQSADADATYRLLADGCVSKTTATIPFPYSEDQARAWIQNVLVRQSTIRKCRELAIECQDTGRFIGIVSAQDVESRTGNVAYWVGPPYWGRGIATEALRLAIHQEWLRDFDVLVGKHLSSNPASGIVLKRNGFVFVGTELRDWRNDGLRELQVYRRCLQGVTSS